VLIIPLRHVANLNNLTPEERAELMEATNSTITLLTDTLGAQGINVGLNLGKAAGAGIPSHLHMHVLPRWNGDTNFLPTLSGTKTISFDLNDIYKKLHDAFHIK
jgi:ATP adenylyltransferase